MAFGFLKKLKEVVGVLRFVPYIGPKIEEWLSKADKEVHKVTDEFGNIVEQVEEITHGTD